jgi:hypothetical protein
MIATDDIRQDRLPKQAFERATGPLAVIGYISRKRRASRDCIVS